MYSYVHFLYMSSYFTIYTMSQKWGRNRIGSVERIGRTRGTKKSTITKLLLKIYYYKYFEIFLVVFKLKNKTSKPMRGDATSHEFVALIVLIRQRRTPRGRITFRRLAWRSYMFCHIASTLSKNVILAEISLHISYKIIS